MYAETLDLPRRLGTAGYCCRQLAWSSLWPPPVKGPIQRPWHLETAAEPSRCEGDESHSTDLARLEAVLFLAKEPQGSRKLAQLASLADGTKARTLVRELNRRYDDEHRALRIMEVAGGFQLLTRPKFAPWLRRLHGAQVEVRLSAPAMETLAVVAYRQPVLRADIEAIRGVQCGEILRQLMERDLVRIAGRSNDLGRPFLYGTTRQFLQVFGLRHLDELPRPELLRNSKPNPIEQRSGEVEAKPLEDNVSNQPTYFNQTGGESNVKSAATLEFDAAEILEENLAAAVVKEKDVLHASEDDDFEEEDEELEDDDEDEDEDDEELEDDEWEEVDDEDEDLEYEDEEEEDEEEWEDEEDEDWEDDDDDWDDDDDEEEEEEEKDEDWE